IRAGRWEQGRECALEAWVSARRCGSDLLAGMAQGNVCIAERGRCRWHNAEDAGRSAIECLTRIGAVPAADHARRSLAIALLKLGKCTEAIAVAEEALPRSEQRGRATDRSYALQLASQARLHLGQVESAQEGLFESAQPIVPISESRPELLRLEY